MNICICELNNSFFDNILLDLTNIFKSPFANSLNVIKKSLYLLFIIILGNNDKSCSIVSSSLLDFLKLSLKFIKFLHFIEPYIIGK